MNRMKLGPLAKLAGSSNPPQSGSEQKSTHETQLTPLSFFLPEPITGDTTQHELLSQQFSDDLTAAISHSRPANRLEAPVSSASETTASTTTFVPVNYQSNHAYPVLVWLHGCDGDHRQLLRVMPAVSDRNYMGLSLRAPVKNSGKLSTKFSSKRNGWSQDESAIDSTFTQIKSELDTLAERFNINRNRVFLAGADAGGTMAYRLAFEHPESFAGVASLNGGLPLDCAPLRNLAKSRQLPVFWVHGRSNTHLPESELCQQLRLLHTAGFDVTLRQYPCDNRLLDPMFGDMNRWMMEMLAKHGANIIS